MVCQSFRPTVGPARYNRYAAADLTAQPATGVVQEDFAWPNGSFTVPDKSWSFVLLVPVVIASGSLSFELLPSAARSLALCLFEPHHPALKSWELNPV